MGFIKKHAKLILILSTVLIVSSCYIVKIESNYSTHLNRITNKFIREMNKDYGLTCSGIGGSTTRTIKKLYINFFCYEKKSIEAARKLEVDCVERLCGMINSNKKIRAYLEEWPFSEDRVGILISFCRKDLTNFLPEESISLIMNCRKKLIYKIEFDDQRPNQTVFEEPYREAYEKVKQGSSFQ